MERMKIVIDGNNFSTLEGFFDEIDRVLTKDLDWKTGHNLDAYNDLLRGGFGVHDIEQPLEIHWINSEKSRRDLGYPAKEQLLQNIYNRCHPSNRQSVLKRLEACKNHQGPTLFDDIIEITIDTDNSGHDCTVIFE